MWRYDSPIGPLYIKQLPNKRFGLVYNDIVWESCNTPQAEADNVFMQCTGCYAWDMLDVSTIDVPCGLSEWEQL